MGSKFLNFDATSKCVGGTHASLHFMVEVTWRVLDTAVHVILLHFVTVKVTHSPLRKACMTISPLLPPFVLAMEGSLLSSEPFLEEIPPSSLVATISIPDLTRVDGYGTDTDFGLVYITCKQRFDLIIYDSDESAD